MTIILVFFLIFIIEYKCYEKDKSLFHNKKYIRNVAIISAHAM